MAASVAAAAALLMGCPPARPQQAMPTTQPVAAPADAQPPEVGAPPTSNGVFTPLPTAGGKLEGESLRKAKLSLDAALAEARAASVVPMTSASPSTAPATAPSTQPAEPPTQAVKYYLRARAKVAEGARAEAMELLRKAYQLDPKSFTVLRLMGEVCFQSNQLSAGSMYLKEAHMLRPEDVEVAYLLGRYFAELKQWPTAVALLSSADRSTERIAGSPVEAKVTFYLAHALHSGGYYAAAAAKFERFLTMLSMPVASYRYDRELSYLTEEEWSVRLMAAEDYAAIGNHAMAAPHYAAAAAGVMKRTGDNPGKAYVLSRQIIALVRLKESPGKLMKEALKLVSASKGSDQSIELLAWVARQAGREEEALRLLEAAAKQNDDQGLSALALAGVQERFDRKQAALATLDRYYQTHASDMGVLERLVKLAVDLKQQNMAFASLARGLDAHNDQAVEIRRLLALVAGDRPTIEQVRLLDKEVPAAAPRVQGKAKYLLALLAEAADDRASAQDYLAAAVQADPLFWPAREAYVAILLATDQFAVAQRVVQDAIESKQGGAKAYQLKIESEAMQGRWSAALKLAEEARTRFPDSAEIALQVANIHAARYERDRAARELRRIIRRFPKFEEGYKSSIELSLAMREPETTFGTLRDLMQAIPNSRYGTVLVASFYSRQGRSDEAQQLLRRLLAEKPGDADVLVTLAQILREEEKGTESVKLLEEALKNYPSPALAEGLATLFRELNRKADALALTERLSREHPNSETWLLLHVSELIAQEKKDQAESLLREAAVKFPRSAATTVRLCRYLSSNGKSAEAIPILLKFNAAHGATADRLYLLGHLYNDVHDDDKSTVALEKVLEINPDHTGACNDLGYFWVDKGRNLARAEALIRKAVENQPGNPAFIDSLGWVLYKQNKIEPAIEQLRKAVDLPGGGEPEVVGHLGDALYRAGQKTEAVEQWKLAVRILEAATRSMPDRDSMLGQFRKQIKQAEANQNVDVAPLAPAEKPMSAGK